MLESKVTARPLIYLAEVGETLCHLWDYSAAEVHYKQSLIYLQGGTPYQYAIHLCDLGEMLLVQRQISESCDVFQGSIIDMKKRI